MLKTYGGSVCAEVMAIKVLTHQFREPSVYLNTWEHCRAASLWLINKMMSQIFTLQPEEPAAHAGIPSSYSYLDIIGAVCQAAASL